MDSVSEITPVNYWPKLRTTQNTDRLSILMLPPSKCVKRNEGELCLAYRYVFRKWKFTTCCAN